MLNFKYQIISRFAWTGTLALLSIMATASCNSAPSTGEVPEIRETVLHDGIGREVHLREPVERAVSLAPDLTEMIFAAGAGDKLVGVTTYCNYPEEARSIEKIGDTQTPNIERIIALRPDVVFVSTASQLEGFMQTLEEQRISVFVLNTTSIDDVWNNDNLLHNLRALGSIFGTESHASKVIEDLDHRISAVDNRMNECHESVACGSLKVFVQISEEPLFTIGRESFLTQLIIRAGGISVTEKVPSGYPKLSKETALALQPEAIIISDSPDNKEPNEVFKNSPAVKNGRVYKINADIISRPGPRLIDALEHIARDLHPDKFPNN
jgi:iron complex transport system substrate-binding protein